MRAFSDGTHDLLSHLPAAKYLGREVVSLTLAEFTGVLAFILVLLVWGFRK